MDSMTEKVCRGMEQSRMIDRRQFVQGGLGLAAAAAAVSMPTEAGAAQQGLKTTWVSHYTYVAPDMKKTRDWYHEVFGMQMGYEDRNEAHLWYGDTGGDTLMIVRQARAGENAPGLERFAFMVDPWDGNTVQAAFRRMGVEAKADTDHKGFWFNDPDGNEVGVFAKDYAERPTASPARPQVWQALSANHIVVTSNDYRKLGDWYGELLDLRETSDAGRDVYQWFGDSVWIPTAVREGRQTSAVLKSLDHVAYTIADYVSADVEAELKRRRMIEPDADVTGSLGINCVDVNGFKTQVCDAILVPNSERRRSA